MLSVGGRHTKTKIWWLAIVESRNETKTNKNGNSKWHKIIKENIELFVVKWHKQNKENKMNYWFSRLQKQTKKKTR